MKTKEQKILDSARTVALSAETWADLSNALFDPIEGLVAKAYPTRDVFRLSRIWTSAPFGLGYT